MGGRCGRAGEAGSRGLLGVFALHPRGERDVGGAFAVGGPVARFAAHGVGVQGAVVELAADDAGGEVELCDGHQVGRLLLLEDELEGAVRRDEAEVDGAAPVEVVLLVVAVLVDGFL